MSSDAIISAIIGSGLLILSSAVGVILKKMSTMDGRLIRIETTFDLMGHKMMGAFHSPHSPEIDAYLEKWQAKVITESEIQALKTLCEQIEADPSKPREERAMAAEQVLYIVL